MSDHLSKQSERMAEDRKCSPLDTYEEVINFFNSPTPTWFKYCKALEEHSDYVVSNHNSLVTETDWSNLFYCHSPPESERFQMKKVLRGSVPKTLVCHDYANGYHDDSFLLGTPVHDAYHFHNWAVIDIFCYFSHHFITIPPLSWINVAHKHGVKVLGTIITEWEGGVKLWEKILKSEETYKEFANILTKITKLYKFEGWLLNVENMISQPQLLKDFVKYFHSSLHSQIKDASLIWYDSVTNSGHLIWQNGLTHDNMDYFKITDGIFTNYSWLESDIERSKLLAGNRAQDVFVGIDVWGRNFYGGGEFNTDEALKLVHKHGCSIAIFGQGWTHEAIDSSGASGSGQQQSKLEKFLIRDRALWDTLWPYLHSKLPKQLPFRTCFCRGQGKNKWIKGEAIRKKPWYNLGLMEYQMNSSHGVHGYKLIRVSKENKKKTDTENLLEIANIVNETDQELISLGQGKYSTLTFAEPAEDEVLSDCDHPKKEHKVQRYKLILTDELPCHDYYGEEAYNGGSCIMLKQIQSDNLNECRIKLLNCDFKVQNKIIVYTITKRLGNKELDMFLDMEDILHSQKYSILLTSKAINENQDEVVKEKKVAFLISPINLSDAAGYKIIQRYLLSNHPDFYHNLSTENHWKVRYYVVDKPNATLNSISCAVSGKSDGHFLLGEIGLCSYDE